MNYRIIEDFFDDKRLEQVRVLLTQSNYEQVIKQGKNILNLFPENARLRGMISAAYQNLGNLKDALRYSEQAVAMDPMDPYCLYIHAKTLFLSARSDEAIGFIEKAIEINPINANYLGLKAGYLLEKGKLEEANQLVDSALIFNPENSSCQNVKSICEQLLNRKDSVDQPHNYYETKLNSSGFFTRGYNAYLNGDSEEAIKFIRESLKLNPHNGHAKKLLVESYKMRFPFYKKYILNHVKLSFKKDEIQPAKFSIFIGLLMIIYVFIVMIDLLIVPTQLDRFYLITFPFIIFSFFIIGNWLIYPFSDLLIIHRKELREIIDRDKLKKSLWTLSAFMVSVIFFIIGIAINSKIFIVHAISLLLFAFIASGNQIKTRSGIIFLVCLAGITILSYVPTIGFKIILVGFLTLFLTFVTINVKKRSQI